ncbi:hypothetical protein JXA31_07490 [Candidatus Bathyarchaeota archaeon]|nr:hypothetical protein [Candidatus Bathyarchaeota archaeon]
MRTNVTYFFVLLTLVSLGLVLVPQVFSQPENIKVLSYSWYIDSFGDFIVVGEVQNNGPNTISSVVLSGIVYTKDGEAQVGSTGDAFVNQLIPQQKAPFYMVFPPQYSVTGDLSWVSIGVDHIDFTVNKAESTTNYQYPDLTVQSSSGGVDAEGAYWVSGTIQNSGTQTATTIRVIGTFYNASGNVIAVGYTDPLTPASLAPSSTVSFKVAAFDLNQKAVPSIQKITDYRLLIQIEGPLLSGTAPSSPPSTPFPSDTTPSPAPTESPSSNNSNNSSNSNPIAPETQYAAVIVVAIIVLAGVILLLRRRKSQAALHATKNRKSRTHKKQK